MSDAASSLPASTLLRLMWLASPALPVGGFSYSEGLGRAVEVGLVVDEAGTRGWLLDQLHLGLARSELPVVAAAHDAWRRDDMAAIGELNDWMLATRESAELRRQTEQMGRSLTAWMRSLSPHDSADAATQRLGGLRPAPAWPVAFALAAQRTGAAPRDALLCFAFGWAENLVQAAIKAVPLGQSAGQRVLGALVDEIPSALEQALGCTASARQAYTPMLALLSAQHETQYSRLFRS
jgi:urease accessory protein